MLINQHAYGGVYGYLAPILHLCRTEGADLFDMYAESLERVWQEAYPFDPAERQSADAKPQHALNKGIGVPKIGQDDVGAGAR